MPILFVIRSFLLGYFRSGQTWLYQSNFSIILAWTRIFRIYTQKLVFGNCFCRWILRCWVEDILLLFGILSRSWCFFILVQWLSMRPSKCICRGRSIFSSFKIWVMSSWPRQLYSRLLHVVHKSFSFRLSSGASRSRAFVLKMRFILVWGRHLW